MNSQKISDTNATSDENSIQETEGFIATNNSGISASSNIVSNYVEETSVLSKSSKSTKCRKNDLCIQQALRSLTRLSSPEEKLTAICAKYADIFDENRKFQATLKDHQKQIAALTKEKEQVRSELMKAIFTKDKLENLCRELQRQNREIKEESLQKIREEEQKRKAVSTKFQTTLNEITELMKQDSDKTMKLRDDNIDMTSKLKSIYEQYEIREQQIEKMAKQMALESQLYEAKIAKLEMESAAEKEMLLREKQQLLLTLTEYQARFQEYQNIEVTLRNQVALYNDKYEEFEKSLTRSNEVFGGFKSEMENMSNKIVKLESETAAWKLRWEKTQKALIEMASEKQKSDQEIVLAAKQMATLHKLCRTLQSERTQLLAKLKDSSPNEASKSDTKSVGDVSSLLQSKTADNVVKVSEKNLDEKRVNPVSEVQNNSSLISEKTQDIPKARFKTDKNPAVAIQNTENKKSDFGVNGSETSVAHRNMRFDTERECADQIDFTNTTFSPQSSNPTPFVESIVFKNEKIADASETEDESKECSFFSNSLSEENIKSEYGSEIKPQTILKGKVANENETSTSMINHKTQIDSSDAGLSQNNLVVSAPPTEADTSLIIVSPNHDVCKSSVQHSKKKAAQRRKKK